MEGRKGCREAARRTRARKRGAVVSLVGAALVLMVTGLWAAGETGDWKLAAAGIGLAVGVLWVANEAEGS